MLNFVFSSDLPSFCLADSTSFSNSLTAYSNVVLVSSTSSTISMFFPTRFAISSELRSSHWVRVTFVPGCSTGPSFPRFSYSDSPMAWMGMLAEPGCLRNELLLVSYGSCKGVMGWTCRRIRAGTYPPPPMAIIRLGLKSLRIREADS